VPFVPIFCRHWWSSVGHHIVFEDPNIAEISNLGVALIIEWVEIRKVAVSGVSESFSALFTLTTNVATARKETHFSNTGDILGRGLGPGGLNFTGSRLLILSKNSDVFLAGVEGNRSSGARLIRLCLFWSSDSVSGESLYQLLIA